MKKPQIKREVAIKVSMPELDMISFYASPDAAQEFADFGELELVKGSSYYWLVIDARFDFAEVEAYIKAYG